MKYQNLNEDWQVRCEPLSRGPSDILTVLGAESGWMETQIPSDVRVPLIETGQIKDPVLGLASFDSEWVEDRSWWYRRTFSVEPDVLGMEMIELVLESIDADGDIFLNGHHLGHHRNAHYPFVAKVAGLLNERDNVLLARVTVGAEHINQDQVSPFKTSVGMTYRRGDERRVFLRKPQYVFGWDWGPRIASCGLPKDVYLRASSKVAARGCSVHTVSVTEEKAVLHVTAEIDNLHDYETREGSIDFSMGLSGDGVVARQVSVLLSSGINHIDFDIEVENPELWWPNGMGGQPLYTVALSVSAGELRDELKPFNLGIRTLELDMSEIGNGERMFVFRVNGRRVYSKGGNWVPADSIYGRVDDEKYRRLVSEAKEANFTMLRIWGGGIYEREIFYEECDRMGILIWHDFMFACALYPDNQDWYVREVEREIDFQTRRLRNHPSMALWSGNNENHWGFHDWWVGDSKPEFRGGAEIYNYIAPKIVRENCAHIPYWRSSPYGGSDPNGSQIGDRHHWHDCTMNPDMEKRITPEEYDKVTSKFVSEYGYIGPCAKTSIERYHGDEPIERFSDVWNWHNNTFEKDTVMAGITKHYVNADELSLDDYLLYAGVVQGLMYGYSLESLRCVENCWGSLIWMYSDCWGEVGWTIIDYYLSRKPSYYYVKRAFAPVKLILRRKGDNITVYGVNDTGGDLTLSVEFGYMSFNGSAAKTENRELTLPACDKGPVCQFQTDGSNERNGTYFIRAAGGNHQNVPTALLRSGPFRELAVRKPQLTVTGFESIDGACHFTVATDVFAHAVHFGIEEAAHLSDSYFDLLPGESKEVHVRRGDISLESLRPKSLFTLE